MQRSTCCLCFTGSQLTQHTIMSAALCLHSAPFLRPITTSPAPPSPSVPWQGLDSRFRRSMQRSKCKCADRRMHAHLVRRALTAPWDWRSDQTVRHPLLANPCMHVTRLPERKHHHARQQCRCYHSYGDDQIQCNNADLEEGACRFYMDH